MRRLEPRSGSFGSKNDGDDYLPDALVHWSGSILVKRECCWRVLITVGGEGIKRRRHVRKEGESNQANPKVSNIENTSYQTLFRLWTGYWRCTAGLQKLWVIVDTIQYINVLRNAV